MMTLDAFRGTLGDAAPPAGLGHALTALWWSGKSEWDRAHGCVQQAEGTPDCDWVHAHLHRVEGDLRNAAYWYRDAGKPVETGPLDAEWAAIAGSLLADRP